MAQAEGVTVELIDPANESHFAVIPEMNMIRWKLRVHPWGDD